MSPHWSPANLDPPASGVTPGTYGDATHVGQFDVNAAGDITGAANVPISGGGGGSSVPLAAVQYAPAALATYTVSNTAGLTALDTVNLTVSFAVPASGKVLVRFSASLRTGTSGNLGLGLLNHSGGAQVGPTLSNMMSASGGPFLMRLQGEWYLTGLAAGALGLDIAAGVSSVAGGNSNIYAMGYAGAVDDAKVGPALIVVYEA